MSNYSENELIPFALKIIKEHEDGIDTKQLLIKLRALIRPDGEDTEVLLNRPDDKFSQKVRNLKSHKTLEKKNLVNIVNNKFFIREEGLKFINEHSKNEISKDILSINILKEWPLSTGITTKLCKKRKRIS